MYLYDKTNKTIDVYEMTPNAERLKKYRQKELANYTVPENKRVLLAATSKERVLENADEQIWYGDLVQDYSGIWGGRVFHTISSYPMTETETTRQKLLLDSFYEGNFSESPVAIITDPFDPQKDEYLSYLEYLLLTQREYKSDFYPTRISTMDDIISIPESLYVLQLLEQGKLAKSLEFDISEQLQGFDFSNEPINRLSINELQKMYQYHLLPGAFEIVMQNVDITSQVLSRRRK